MCAALFYRGQGAQLFKRQFVPVRRQEVRLKGFNHERPGGSVDLPPVDAETVHQAVDAVDGVMLGLVSQVSVAGGRENGLMTENLLDLDQVNASFDQVRGVAVAQAVWRDLFFRPQVSMTLCSVVWTPPASIGVLAVIARFSPP